ncbi:MAG TPA: hypothetical protein VFQ78_10820 [Candidatus Udaeobacter sp.]|nr:hypothetical protein [Candidatus Udaeobacter sp.]
MKKITLSFQLLAAIIAVTILQAYSGTPDAPDVPRLPTPQFSPNGGTVCGNITVTITIVAGAHMVYWFDNNQLGRVKRQRSVTVVFPTARSGRTLYAIACPGLNTPDCKKRNGVRPSLVAVGTYYCPQHCP